MTDRLPVLWLYGPPAVGKTTAGWRLFTELPAPVGYIDIDQIGMGYGPPIPENWAPEPAYDLGRHRMKARNLDAVAANFRAAGARGLVVSGVVDPARGTSIEPLPHVDLTSLRLRADQGDLRQRVARRNGPYDDLPAILEHAGALDRLPGRCLDTTGRDVREVVRLIRERIGTWPGRSSGAGTLSSTDQSASGRSAGTGTLISTDHSASEQPAGTGTLISTDHSASEQPAGAGALSSTGRAAEIIWLCGSAGIGKSAVGWFVYQQWRQAGRRAAFVDLDQVGFRRPADAGNHRLKAANLAALWETYAAAGADCLVAVGPLTPGSVAAYTAALPAATITLVRLTATPPVLTARIQARGRGESPASGLAGDRLAGRAPAVLERITAESIREADALERAGVGDITIATDERPPPDLATEIINRHG